MQRNSPRIPHDLGTPDLGTGRMCDRQASRRPEPASRRGLPSSEFMHSRNGDMFPLDKPRRIAKTLIWSEEPSSGPSSTNDIRPSPSVLPVHPLEWARHESIPRGMTCRDCGASPGSSSGHGLTSRKVSRGRAAGASHRDGIAALCRPLERSGGHSSPEVTGRVIEVVMRFVKESRIEAPRPPCSRFTRAPGPWCD